jgi:hypothetical protein
MNLPFRTVLTFLVLAVLMLLQYQNCSQYADPNPFTMPTTSLTASSSGPTQVKLDSPNGVIDLGQNDQALSVGGECNVGLSTRHYIEVKLSDYANVPLPVQVAPQNNLCPTGTNTLPAECFVAKQFSCEHGRYYIHIPVTCAAFRGQTQSLYRLVGQLVTFDANGKEVRDNKAMFDRFINIAWAPTACQ